MIVLNEKIPLSKYEHWHQLLVQARGHYIVEPALEDNFVVVSYESGDYSVILEGWKQMNKPSYEVRCNQTWKRFANRVLTGRIKG